MIKLKVEDLKKYLKKPEFSLKVTKKEIQQ